MEQEPNSQKPLDNAYEQASDLKTIGQKASDALRGYGYDDLADKYDQVLHRSAPDSKEVLAHSRIANSALKELNTMAESQQGRHPALERTVQLQQQLDVSLQKQTAKGVNTRSIEDLSFPAKLYLEEKSQPLKNAAYEVAKYLDEKRKYSHPAEGKTLLQQQLDAQLQSYQSLPTSQNMENLERHTQQGIQVMKQDYEKTKAALQQENDQYVASRNYLSPEGRRLILSEAEKGEFEMPNRIKGNIVSSRANYAQGQLDQYSQVKERIFAIEQRQNEITVSGIPTGNKNYSHLSTEQQQQYANLTKTISLSTTEKSTEMER
ncbi:MAG: hypothetical protein RIG62_24165 [Cyclobacteriaceae bacterium]